MSLIVRVEEFPRGTVVRLGGAVDPEVLTMVGDGLAAVTRDGRAVVLDVGELTTLDPIALERLASALDAADPEHPGRVIIACARPSARRLIERRLRDTPLPVFPSVDCALEAAEARSGELEREALTDVGG